MLREEACPAEKVGDPAGDCACTARTAAASMAGAGLMPPIMRFTMACTSGELGALPLLAVPADRRIGELEKLRGRLAVRLSTPLVPA